MSNWKDEIKEQDEAAFKALDLNTGRYQNVIEEARDQCPYFGEARDLWLEGFDDAKAEIIEKLHRHDEAVKEAALEAIEDGDRWLRCL